MYDEESGVGELRYSLWTSDLGLAIYLADSTAAEAHFRTLDVFRSHLSAKLDVGPTRTRFSAHGRVRSTPNPAIVAACFLQERRLA